MKKTIFIPGIAGIILLLTSFGYQKPETYSLTIEVADLRNSNGVVQFSLYNKADVFPDEHYKNYYRQMHEEIDKGTSKITFTDLPPGKYAVNILHDEDENGEIKKGLILPKEGIGFSNYQSIGLSNRPKFSKAAFVLQEDKTIAVKIIYL